MLIRAEFRAAARSHSRGGPAGRSGRLVAFIGRAPAWDVDIAHGSHVAQADAGGPGHQLAGLLTGQHLALLATNIGHPLGQQQGATANGERALAEGGRSWPCHR